jgi:pimeloyl-ACP methyl ester carboxylesterase
VIHPIDRSSGLVLANGPQRLRIFQEGWGDQGLIDELVIPAHPDPPAAIEIDWLPPEVDDGLTVRDGVFASPGAFLPAHAATAHVRQVIPRRPTNRMCVLLAAWNDHGYDTRTKLAARLAERGIAAAMLENPFYGHRRPRPEADQPIRTVGDFAVMGRSAVSEGRALLAHFAADYQVGVSGYSMGGNVSALVGALMEFPVAIAALAASHSPGPVYLDGVLVNGIDWEALGGRQTAEPRLRQVLTGASVLRIEPRPHTASAVIVGAKSDGYVPLQATLDLHEHWPGSELRLIRGGHATLIWFRKDVLVDAIVDSFDRLEAAGV